MQFIESWSEEIASKANRVQNLIGAAHWLTVGRHKESLLRDFLRRAIPSRFTVSSGFIANLDHGAPVNFADQVSREIDILITDKEAELHWFDEGDVVVVPPEAAKAQVHVKTEFGTSEIKDCLTGAEKALQVFSSSRRRSDLWSAAVFFAHNRINSEKDWEKVFRSAVSKLQSGTSSSLDCLAILNGPVVVKSLSGEGTYYIGYDVGKLGVGFLLYFLYDAITKNIRDQTRMTPWERLVDGAEFPQIFKFQIS